MAEISNGESGSSVRTKLNASLVITDGITNLGSGEIITGDERTKLEGIEDAAQANNVLSLYMGTFVDDPTGLTERKNVDMGELAMARTGIGTYEITSADSRFSTTKSFLRLMPDAVCFWSAVIDSTSLITVTIYDSTGSPTDTLLPDAKIEIITYR